MVIYFGCNCSFSLVEILAFIQDILLGSRGSLLKIEVKKKYSAEDSAKIIFRKQFDELA